jgi:hypothetical protein
VLSAEGRLAEGGNGDGLAAFWAERRALQL